MGAFANSGVELSYQNFQHPTYRQRSETFLPYMGIIDVLANEGPEATLKIMRSGRGQSFTSDQVKAKQENDEKTHG